MDIVFNGGIYIRRHKIYKTVTEEEARILYNNLSKLINKKDVSGNFLNNLRKLKTALDNNMCSFAASRYSHDFYTLHINKSGEYILTSYTDKNKNSFKYNDIEQLNYDFISLEEHLANSNFNGTKVISKDNEFKMTLLYEYDGIYLVFIETNNGLYWHSVFYNEEITGNRFREVAFISDVNHLKKDLYLTIYKEAQIIKDEEKQI